MEFSRQEYWSGLPFPSSGDLPDPVIKSWSLALQAASLLSEPPEKPKEEQTEHKVSIKKEIIKIKAELNETEMKQ